MEAYKNPKLSPAERADDLIGRMTLREKVGQLAQRLYGFSSFTRRGDEISLSEEFCREVEYYGGLGTLYGLYRADPWSGRDFNTGLDGVLALKARNLAQKYVVEHSRFGIPMLMSTEAPHGHQALDSYLLPVNLASGCSFSPVLLGSAVEVSGSQLREMGVDLALMSVLDMLRDPRWGRSEECFSEDPYLVCRMAEAAVKAMQEQGVEVTAKHMCAQGETTGGVNASAARIGQRELREIHLPPVKACVDAGVTSFMAAYNEIDGVYCHGNPWLLRTVLREEYGFEGFVMSDGCAIDQLDAVTGDRAASGALALNSGVDMGLWDTGFQLLEEALARGLVEEKTIDEAVKRILVVKFRRGLFENPYVSENCDWQKFDYHHYCAVKTLTEHSLVLLKNDQNMLPITAGKKIGLVGPNADAPYNQLGDYTPPVREGSCITPRTGLQSLIDALGGELVYHPGCGVFAGDDAMIRDAVTAVRDCDVVVAALGGTSSRFASADAEFDSNGAIKNQSAVTMDCGENVDSSDVRLPGRQMELLKALKEAGKRVVTVLIGGRPYEMDWIEAWSDAIVVAFYPGLTGGEAIAKLLFGQIEPAGRLSVSLPDKVGQLPVYYNGKDSYKAGRYYDASRPRYGFGSGLSYTAFSFETVTPPASDDLTLTVTVKNTGSRPGWAVPQLYLHRTQGVVTSRIRQLCGFEKLYLEPGQQKQVTISVPADSLTQWDHSMKQICPRGRIDWFLCDNGEEKLTGSFVV